MNDLFFLYFQHAINLQLSSLSFVIRKKINWIYCFLFSFLRSTSGYLPLDLVISSLLSSLKIKNNVVYFLTSGEGNGTPLQYSCLENPVDRGAWWAAVHGVTRSQTRLSDFSFTFHFHALEKEMATHSSVLAWRIPGTEEPGGLLSTG